MSELIQTISAFSLYFITLFGIGIYFYKKNTNETDFALGNRSLNYWLTAISAQASDMSDWLFMAFPGVLYAHGLCESWIAVGLVLFMGLTWKLVAPKLRILSEQHGSVSFASFLAQQLKCSSWFKILSSIICMYFFIFYIAAGLIGLGKVFQTAFGIDYHTGIIMSLIITVLYTSLGGLTAIAWSDLVQGTFLLAVLCFVPLYTIFTQYNSFSHFIEISLITVPQNFFSFIPQNGISALVTTAFGIMSWGLGYFGQPHILVNFMGIDDPKKIKSAQVVGLTWQILALSGAIAVAIVGKVFLPELANRELVFITLVKSLFSPFFAGIILCAVLAATISTINTQTLVSATLFGHDILGSLHLNISQHTRVMIQRVAIFFMPLASLYIAWNESYNVLESVLYAWNGLGSSFGPLTLLALYTNWITPAGAYTTLLTGAATSILWPYLGTTVPTLVASYIIASSMGIVISWITKRN
jgi:sodium/proline symporter